MVVAVDETDVDVVEELRRMQVEIVEIVEEMRAVLEIEEDKTLLPLEADDRMVEDTEAQEVLT